MSDRYFHDILGVARDAPREQIRAAYRVRVMETHPDRFPPEHKAEQELAMIALTEAYAALMNPTVAAMEDEHARPLTSAAARASAAAGARSAAPRARPAASSARGPVRVRTAQRITTPAAHRDPAYAYYKQGFVNFSLAIHGIAEINRKIAAGRLQHRPRRYIAAEDAAGSLEFLRSSHAWFTRVVEGHPGSVWFADARAKLRRIEHLTAIYRRILSNLSSKPAQSPP
jgi:curved DNA-binding protein CbpA